MRFLKKLLTWFAGSTKRKPLEYVRSDGAVARFVFAGRDLYPDGKPKAKVFKPELNPNLDRFETSVCGLHGVASERVSHLGRTIRAQEGLSAIVAVKLSVSAVTSAGLACESAPEPDFEEHGVIVGWNPDPSAKDERLAFQTDLAASVATTDVIRLS